DGSMRGAPCSLPGSAAPGGLGLPRITAAPSLPDEANPNLQGGPCEAWWRGRPQTRAWDAPSDQMFHGLTPANAGVSRTISPTYPRTPGPVVLFPHPSRTESEDHERVVRRGETGRRRVAAFASGRG